ncbi:MAG: alpha/beta fold hydrolase [Anaerolineae bacterium]|jgi:uncharacterized protein|nr:alpha/beta fold hydrolase [Anaerolineae bacterium]MBT7070707.1 alpha/beta fold hydrolase [Anaerolineae bacterium]MBT7323905.1 alpha/beta fold hydrolase [Anaerolineae bacterium]
MLFFWLFLLLIIFIIILDLFSRRAYAYEKRPHRKTPEKYGISFEEVHIPVAEGGQLYGWWIPSTPDAPTLILIHGWSRNIERVLPYIRNLYPRGYNLLAIDARKHGSSSEITAPTVGTFTEDVLAAVKYVGEKNASTQIGLIGLSIGGGASIAAAGQNQRIQAAVTVGAMAHPLSLMAAHFEERHIPKFIASALFLYLRIRFGIDYEKIAPLNHISNATGKILLVHGVDDETVPLAHGHMLAAANPASASLWEVPAKGHSDCHLHPDFWEKISAFLDKNLK